MLCAYKFRNLDRISTNHQVVLCSAMCNRFGLLRSIQPYSFKMGYPKKLPEYMERGMRGMQMVETVCQTVPCMSNRQWPSRARLRGIPAGLQVDVYWYWAQKAQANIGNKLDGAKCDMVNRKTVVVVVDKRWTLSERQRLCVTSLRSDPLQLKVNIYPDHPHSDNI